MTKLVIFDMDHTLIDVFSVHDKAYHKTMKEVFGLKACYKDLDYTGKRIPDLITEYALKEGVTMPVIKMNLEQAEREYELNFAMHLRNVKKHVLPGVPKLLEALKKKKYKLAIVTGDLRSITDILLKGANLKQYFPVIVTSDDAPTRKDEVKLAVTKSGKADEIWVIGDSTRDIEAAKANGINNVISVMTGSQNKKTLAAKKPAYIFKDLSHTRKILEAIG